MKPQYIYSFPYNNYFSNIVFDNSDTGYFIASDHVENNEIVSCKILSISANGEINVLINVAGIVDYKTLKICGIFLLFGVCKKKGYKLCAYHLNGTFAWEVPFDNPILEVDCIPNGNIVVTTYAGNEKTITWLACNGNVINTHTSCIRFANFIPNNNCVFVSTENNVMVCDFNGNIRKKIDVENTVFSMWENYSNVKNTTANVVVTSKNAIYTINQNCDIIHEYNLGTEQQSKISNGINSYGLNCFSDNICYVMQNGWLSGKLQKIDIINDSIIAEYNSKKMFMNTPLVTKEGKVVAVINSNCNSSNCIVFDSMLNELHKSKICGEVFKFAVNNDKIYILTLNKNLNEIEIYSLPIQ